MPDPNNAVRILIFLALCFPAPLWTLFVVALAIAFHKGWIKLHASVNLPKPRRLDPHD